MPVLQRQDLAQSSAAGRGRGVVGRAHLQELQEPRLLRLRRRRLLVAGVRHGGGHLLLARAHGATDGQAEHARDDLPGAGAGGVHHDRLPLLRQCRSARMPARGYRGRPTLAHLHLPRLLPQERGAP